MIAYLAFRLLIFIFWLIPFWLLYRLSDFLQWLFFNIVKYRYKVIEKNLKNAFPEKSEQEIRPLIKGAYSNICDSLVETLKGLSLSLKQLTDHCVIANPELLEHYRQKGQSVLILASHCCNFEWGMAMENQVKMRIMTAYKPLRNPRINDYARTIRETDNLTLIPFKKTYEDIPKYQDRPHAFFLVADQSPSNKSKAHWLSFFNQDTAFHHGPDTLARMFNYPILYADLRRIDRGKYTITFSVLHEDPNSLGEQGVTKIYRDKLTEVINEHPHNWLWSHKRWKHKRENIS